MSNKSAKNLLICNFGSICFLNGVVTRNNPLTYHHIIPQRIRKITTYENGALLTYIQHSKFNVIENYSRSIANEINDGFREFKQTEDIRLIKQMGDYVDKKTRELGYTVENKGKILVLRRF